MPRVVHFEISADNPERAVQFYTKTFGWQIQQWGSENYWLVTTGDKSEPGIDGAINRRSSQPTPIVNTIDVASIDEAVSKVTANGGQVVAPKMPVPGIGWLAYCTDTEGNQFGMMQRDENAH
ncbi:MAG: VOC family protein [Anaerolineae bacterium]|nr:VOC family protein [Anaerolineae bacterium]